jgi:hypothetical protein
MAAVGGRDRPRVEKPLQRASYALGPPLAGSSGVKRQEEAEP